MAPASLSELADPVPDGGLGRAHAVGDLVQRQACILLQQGQDFAIHLVQPEIRFGGTGNLWKLF